MTNTTSTVHFSMLPINILPKKRTTHRTHTINIFSHIKVQSFMLPVVWCVCNGECVCVSVRGCVFECEMVCVCEGVCVTCDSEKPDKDVCTEISQK